VGHGGPLLCLPRRAQTQSGPNDEQASGACPRRCWGVLALRRTPGFARRRWHSGAVLEPRAALGSLGLAAGGPGLRYAIPSGLAACHALGWRANLATIRPLTFLSCTRPRATRKTRLASASCSHRLLYVSP
jgi:hypothetical protein